jgi:hypothetical protein
MFIVCNGAAKSGSTWLYNIVNNLVPCQWPAPDYLSKSNSKHPTITENHLTHFLNNVDFYKQHIISKNHFAQPLHRDQLLISPDTRVLDMSRDSRDVIVSSYYDACRRNNYQGNFSDFYWSKGRHLVNSLRRYHDVWALPHRQILVTSFELLKSDFGGEVSKIAKFLNVELSELDIIRIEQASSINSLRENYKDDQQYNSDKNPFFRKGIIGDWQNHFDNKMRHDYEKVKNKGIGKFDLIALRHQLLAKIVAFLPFKA